MLVESPRKRVCRKLAVLPQRTSVRFLALAFGIVTPIVRHLGALLWHPPEERTCDTCQSERAPVPKLRRIHMSFVRRDRWHCTFMEDDLRASAGPSHTFVSADNMVEMIRRGNGFRDLSCRQAVEHALAAGHGNIDLLLTPEQYAKLAKQA